MLFLAEFKEQSWVKSFIRGGRIVNSYDRQIDKKKNNTKRNLLIGGGVAGTLALATLALKRGKGRGKLLQKTVDSVGNKNTASVTAIQSKLQNVAQQVQTKPKYSVSAANNIKPKSKGKIKRKSSVRNESGTPLNQTSKQEKFTNDNPSSTNTKPNTVETIDIDSVTTDKQVQQQVKKLSVYGIDENAPIADKLREIGKKAKNLKTSAARKTFKQNLTARKNAERDALKLEKEIEQPMSTTDRNRKTQLIASKARTIEEKTEAIKKFVEKRKAIREEWNQTLLDEGIEPKQLNRLKQRQTKLQKDIELEKDRRAGKVGYKDDKSVKRELQGVFQAKVKQNNRLARLKRDIAANTEQLRNKSGIAIRDNWVESKSKANIKRLREQYKKGIAGEVTTQKRRIEKMREPIVKDGDALKEEIWNDIINSTVPKAMKTEAIATYLSPTAAKAYKQFNTYKDADKLWNDYVKWGDTEMSRRDMFKLGGHVATKWSAKKPRDVQRVMTQIKNIFGAQAQYNMKLQKPGMPPVEIKLNADDYNRLIEHYSLGQGQTTRDILRFLGLPV